MQWTVDSVEETSPAVVLGVRQPGGRVQQLLHDYPIPRIEQPLKAAAFLAARVGAQGDQVQAGGLSQDFIEALRNQTAWSAKWEDPRNQSVSRRQTTMGIA